MRTHSPVAGHELAVREPLSVVTNTAAAGSDSQKAWHLLYLVFSIGRPATLLEVASRCAPFRATPDLVRSLCSLLDSPIALTCSGRNGACVTASMLGRQAIRRFWSNSESIHRFLILIGVGLGVDLVGGSPPLQDSVRIYFNKRKRIGFVPQGDAENEDPNVSRPVKRIRTVGLKVPFFLSKLMESSVSNLTPFPECFPKTVVSRLDYRLKDNRHIEDEYDLTAISEGDEEKTVSNAEVSEEFCIQGVKSDDLMEVMLSTMALIPEWSPEIVLSRLDCRLQDAKQIEDEHVSTAIMEREKQKPVSSDGHMDIMVNDRVHVPECLLKTVESSSDSRSKDAMQLEDEPIPTAIVEGKVQKAVASARKVDNHESDRDVIVNEKVEHCIRSNIEAGTCNREVQDSTMIPVECEMIVNDSFDSSNKIGDEGLEIIHDREIEFGGTQTEAGTSSVALKTGLCGMPTANGCEETKIEATSIKELVTIVGSIQTEARPSIATLKTGLCGMPIEDGCEEKKMQECLKKELVTTDTNKEDCFKTLDLSVTEKHLQKSSAKTRFAKGNRMSSRHQALRKSIDKVKPESPVKRQQGNEHHIRHSIPPTSKRKHDDVQAREGRKDAAAAATSNVRSNTESCDQVEPKGLPTFESYIVDEEEGSGGYGTVYRARRKGNGGTVAIKFPHANAHKQHVTNEQRMLERFGGRNYIIRYEGHFKSENSDCFVLEHVEHDRPEVLKKEIDLVQIRWYAYCLFRALSSLHKQARGIVHRDVKPGNFLFSRKANKGYLIDFNLALDLHQKCGANTKFRTGNDKSFSDAMLNKSEPFQPVKAGRAQNLKSLDVSREESKGSKTWKKKAGNALKAQNDMRGWNLTQSQGAEGSGVTSVKDLTSNRTPSAERLREPLPSHGRKALLSLLHETMNSPNHEASSAPSSTRKRVAAPPSKVDGRLLYVSPMPLQPSGMAVTLNGFTKGKDGKLKKEGPCVGTKGFRAPEVLLRSQYQGPKVDSWSAGVTLLYLMIGRTPFYGEPEQNIKEIAKLRGSEDLWEVAKLHDRESSFPPELYNAQSLQSLPLREWCKINTKRRGFLDQMPSSLVDLVDKCLTVNPRSRISCEDALKHEFFAPLHEIIKKHKLAREGDSTAAAGPGTTRVPLHKRNSVEPLANLI
ncbi:unnamed protein product [Linum tenue]|uniref:non-specific serine/threonine protein kinase n=1 Tax=Linum tenue TaxID=586396 RepID=A0AAV0K9U7_9ROSI|nr:unnamed protein product [Linum tenue]